MALEPLLHLLLSVLSVHVDLGDRGFSEEVYDAVTLVWTTLHVSLLLGRFPVLVGPTDPLTPLLLP